MALETGCSGSSVIESSDIAGLDPTELERLPFLRCLPPKGEVCVGDPDSPRVVIDGLRGWLDWPGCLPELPNESEARDARRWWMEEEEGTEIGEVARSFDMIQIRTEE